MRTKINLGRLNSWRHELGHYLLILSFLSGIPPKIVQAGHYHYALFRISSKDSSGSFAVHSSVHHTLAREKCTYGNWVKGHCTCVMVICKGSKLKDENIKCDLKLISLSLWISILPNQLWSWPAILKCGMAKAIPVVMVVPPLWKNALSWATNATCYFA